MGRKPSKPADAGERKKAEQELLEAVFAYGHALEYQDRQEAATAAKREDAAELVDGAAQRLLTAARVYFVACQAS
jgi:hypothetical protein